MFVCLLLLVKFRGIPRDSRSSFTSLRWFRVILVPLRHRKCVPDVGRRGETWRLTFEVRPVHTGFFTLNCERGRGSVSAERGTSRRPMVVNSTGLRDTMSPI